MTKHFSKSFLVAGVIAAIGAPAWSAGTDTASVIAAARANCLGISERLNEIKTMAGIGTAVTGVGTATGLGTVVVGGVKSSTDKKAEQINMTIVDLEKQLAGLSAVPANTSLSPEYQKYRAEFIEYYTARIRADINAMMNDLSDQHAELDAKSKTLGNVRTGLAAGTTAASIGGAVLASQAKTDDDLQTQVRKCLDAVDAVRNHKMQARMNGEDITKLDEIVSACDKYSTVNLTKIDKRGAGAQWSSVAGAVTGAVSVATSAAANTSNVRNTNTATGADSQKEKSLNATANVFAGGATVANAIATGFNASQIKAINDASDVAEKCEKALQ